MTNLVTVVRGEGMVVRIAVTENVVRIVTAGPRGEPGPQGPQGLPGTGASGKRWYGEGPPELIIGASPGDEYVDALTGTLYVLQ